MALGKDYTPGVIALKVGKSRQYVTGRLQLLKLEPKLKDAFYQGQMNVAVALRLTRLQPANQLAAFQVFPGQRTHQHRVHNNRAGRGRVDQTRGVPQSR
ncbi:MAG TPA: hypothetical protein VIX19_03555 [Terriglobales bacterium]